MMLICSFVQAKFWKQYVEAHMAVNNDDAIKQIFSRCLLNCLQIPLWYVVLFNLIRPVVDVFVSVYALLDMLFKRL